MTILETIEDAFLEALEEGANPPREFAIRLPWNARYLAAAPEIQVAGHLVFLRYENEAPTWH